ncbi:hypothetical protein BST81_21980 [Leptolyngbya sp. 'hensonii']|uniref:SH3 domain-containing protein n=1 Tax=Leptolyngbya sp. 'hensonii' TaxID=1922337 RepID=UPI00094F9A2E|nr:SH3 domain-containing protein [Leptolyngbya sp. 'hensonii']OLP16273.1 hypothetical protein BST81_21980 [Leptolyngbya sp. 'hensonii']
METLAFIHTHALYENSAPDLELNLLDPFGSIVASSAKVSLVGAAVVFASWGPVLQAAAVVKRGDTCATVQDVQRALAREGYSIGSVDGVFGGKTEFAVKRFQANNQLTSDGVVGAKTAAALGLGQAGDANSPFVAGKTCAGTTTSGGGGAPATVQIKTSSGNLRVRSGPGTNYPVVASLANGSVVRTTGQQSNGWIQLVNNAWVAAKYTIPATASSGGGGTPTPTPSSIKIVTGGANLRVRSGPGTNYSTIAALGNGSIVRTTGAVSNGWIQVEGGGWIASKYARSN